MLGKHKSLPIVSIGLVACNTVLYLCCLFGIGNLYETGSLDAEAVLLRGEYGRVISSMFLHADTQHLLGNMMIVLFMGAMAEREIGHICYGILYFLSGVGGNLLSLYWKVATGSHAVSIGASGAAFGLDGVLLAMMLFWGERIENVSPAKFFVMILLSLYSGMTAGNIDNAAHVGGLITGFAAGSLVCVVRRLLRR